jgi:hypothetical protein
MSKIAASSPLSMTGTIRAALALALVLAAEAGLAFTIENAGLPYRPSRYPGLGSRLARCDD